MLSEGPRLMVSEDDLAKMTPADRAAELCYGPLEDLLVPWDSPHSKKAVLAWTKIWAIALNVLPPDQMPEPYNEEDEEEDEDLPMFDAEELILLQQLEPRFLLLKLRGHDQEELLPIRLAFLQLYAPALLTLAIAQSDDTPFLRSYARICLTLMTPDYCWEFRNKLMKRQERLYLVFAEVLLEKVVKQGAQLRRAADDELADLECGDYGGAYDDTLLEIVKGVVDFVRTLTMDAKLIKGFWRTALLWAGGKPMSPRDFYNSKLAAARNGRDSDEPTYITTWEWDQQLELIAGMVLLDHSSETGADGLARQISFLQLQSNAIQSKSMCAAPGCFGGAIDMRCSRCQAAQYCSRECQRSAWDEHKLYCIQTDLSPDVTFKTPYNYSQSPTKRKSKSKGKRTSSKA